ncbi:MAG: hypothetical protein ACOC56_02855 [Atribacterota bacterium]
MVNELEFILNNVHNNNYELLFYFRLFQNPPENYSYDELLNKYNCAYEKVLESFNKIKINEGVDYHEKFY